MKKTALLVALIILINLSCKKNKTEIPIPLPHIWTFTINDDDLKPLMQLPQYQDTTKINAFIAAKNFNIWQTFIKQQTPLAYYALLNAYSAECSYFANNTWLWEYNVMYNSQNYKLKLYGTLLSDSIYWEAFSVKNNYQKRLFTGKCDTAYREGYWIFYNNKYSPIKKIKIIWHAKYIDTLYKKQFIIIDTNSLNYNNCLIISNLDTEFYKIRIKEYDKRKNEKFYIKIDQTKKGMIKDYYFFKDSIWHCWNSNFLNINCQKN